MPEAVSMVTGNHTASAIKPTAEKIAELKHRAGKHSAAAEWYQRAINEGKKDASLYFQLANAYTALRDFKAAEHGHGNSLT